eukprot:gene20863-25056_t
MSLGLDYWTLPFEKGTFTPYPVICLIADNNDFTCDITKIQAIPEFTITLTPMAALSRSFSPSQNVSIMFYNEILYFHQVDIPVGQAIVVSPGIITCNVVVKDANISENVFTVSTTLADVGLYAKYLISNFRLYDIPYPFGYTSRSLNGSVTFTATFSIDTSMSFQTIKNHTFCGHYDTDLQKYRIDFTIAKQQNVGILPFYLLSSITYLSNADFTRDEFPNSGLTINSTLYISDNQTIGWDLTIEDYPNSFKSGVAKVISTLDNEPIVISFDASNRISGDQFKGVYSIRFWVHAPCLSQTYTLTSLQLLDAGELDIHYDFPMLGDMELDGIQPIIGDPNLDDKRNISIICPELTDTTPPELVSFTSDQSSVE